MKQILIVILILFTFGLAQEVKIDSVAIQTKMSEVLSDINAIDAEVNKLLEQRNKSVYAYNVLASMLVPLKVEEEKGKE